MNNFNSFSGFVQWQELFDENVSNAWEEESFSSLKNISMLLFCLAKEIRKVHCDMRKKVLLLREGTLTAPENNEKQADKQKNSPESGSLLHDEIGSFVLSEEASDTKSPEFKMKHRLKSSRRKLRGKVKRKLNNDATPVSSLGDAILEQDLKNLNITNASHTTTEKENSKTPTLLQESDSDLDFSVVQCTPQPLLVSERQNRQSAFKKQRGTIIQMSLKNYQVNQKIRSKPNTSSPMDITQMVSYINKEASTENIKTSDIHNSNIDSIANNDFTYLSSKEHCSDKDNSVAQENACANLNEFLAEAQSIPSQLEAEPLVRGKERQKLPGWSCKNCEKFYLQQGLNRNELVSLIKCSKHRGYYKPREDTVPGYWDMDVSSQEKENG